ncbi:adhesion G-protein coupled receptor D1-like [Sycon ciliatum]|uniref:adhesion G-protein coupled receptor D1-like n=1 Tax=Sycon ciliatum TaxID=27933 RepID=UPI0031F66DE3
MCGLLATIIIISVLKKQRSHSHQKLMIGLCTTLFLVLLLFVSAVEPAAWNRGLCQTIAFLMHYLLLMAFMWMSADATLLYTQLVTVFGGLSIGNLLNYMLLLIFGLPLLIVVVTAASTQMEAYGNEHHCWIADNAVFYAAFFAPMCITLLYNMIILITVIRSLHHRSKNVKTASRKKDTSGKVYLLRISVSLSLMLGLTWLFGMLTVLTDHIAVQYIFALFNTLQGLFIFLHTIQSKDVRKEWTESFSSSSRRRSTRDTFASGSYPLVTIRRLVDMGDSRIGKFRNSFRSSLSKRDSQRPKTSTAEAQTTSAATTQDITSSRSTDRPVATDSSSTVYASIAPARSRASTYTEPTSQTTCSPGDTVIVGALPPENTPISSDDHQIIYTLLSFDDVPVKGKVTVFEENQPVAAVEVHETTWNQGTAQGVEETIAESIPAKREWISSSV